MGSTAMQKLRGAIAHCMIDDARCYQFDLVALKTVPKTVLYNNNTYTCLLCGRIFDSYKSIFYHLLVHHSYEVDYWVRKYLVEKYRLIGWLHD